ncbi:helix-turn-helix domain-containing protein [Nocardiopsis valliformis]|uniref:helix-turn-helix domain-containing protein n=1 Tax=Nocardiopsis valliformis TaxID=239974 RepID=UPI0003703726|nr:helix-turn-helix transcriptional regulator [Nocardiopsis valliformis]
MTVMPLEKEIAVRYGGELRGLREAAGLTQTALAHAANTSKSTISAVERGITVPTPVLREAFDRELGKGHLARIWEELTGDGREAWKREVAELIDAASAVYEYLVLVWPAHLQTEAYAHALIRYGAQWLSADEVGSRARDRAMRAQRLTDTEHPRLWLVADEALLYRRYGGSETTREQLSLVTGLVESGRVTLQLIPMDTPPHPGTSGPFKLITTKSLPDVMFAESAREGQLVTNTTETANWRMQFAALQSAAMGPEATLTRLKAELRKLDDE